VSGSGGRSDSVNGSGNQSRSLRSAPPAGYGLAVETDTAFGRAGEAASQVAPTPAAAQVAEASQPRVDGANDQPTAVDRMGFKPYVDALAQVLTSEGTNPPFTVALEGEWGSGKSSFIYQLRQAIEARHQTKLARAARTPVRAVSYPAPREPRFVTFNAWQHDKDEALWASFALEFVRQVAPKRFWSRIAMQSALLHQRADKKAILTRVVVGTFLVLLLLLIVAKKVFFPTLNSDDGPSALQEWMTYLSLAVPGALAGSWLTKSIVTVLPQAVKAPLGDLKKFVEQPDYKSKLGFLERFHDDFAKCVNAYTGGSRTFVFVDDLDRCEVPKAVELLQALNLLLAANLPLVVVLAIDRPKIAAGVAVRNRELLAFLPRPGSDVAGLPADENRIGIAYGHEFVEKFVQLSLRIPRLGAETAPAFLDSLVFPASATGTGDQRGGQVARDADEEDPVTSDGTEVRRMLDLVAPTLGFNPRRLKQFLNLFRVRYFIASKTGQLERQQGRRGWTISQLGKIVAIEVLRPRLLDELLAAPHAVADLHDAAHSAEQPKLGSIGARWQEDQALMELLRRPPGGAEGQYGLRGVGSLLPRLYGAGAPTSKEPDPAVEPERPTEPAPALRPGGPAASGP